MSGEKARERVLVTVGKGVLYTYDRRAICVTETTSVATLHSGRVRTAGQKEPPGVPQAEGSN